MTQTQTQTPEVSVEPTREQELRALIENATQSDLADDGRYFRDSCNDLTSCRHGETGEYNDNDDGKLVEFLWNNRHDYLDRLASQTPPATRQGDPDAQADEYAAEYLMTTKGADYEPTKFERALIQDALHGFIAGYWPAPPATQPSTTVGVDARDAARWRALWSSDRIRMMGCTGFDFAEDGSVTMRADAGHHMGVEVWDRHPAKGDDSDSRGRKVLLAYVDARAATLHTPPPVATATVDVKERAIGLIRNLVVELETWDDPDLLAALRLTPQAALLRDWMRRTATPTPTAGER